MRFIKKIVIALMLLIATKVPVFAVGFDDKINNLVAPISDKVAGVIFYPIPLFGSEIPACILWLLIGAIVCTFATKFISVWGFGHAIDIILGKVKEESDESDSNEKNEGEVSSLQALATALSGTIGLGNIAGVAIAISMGGPGATFWMWIGALFGMAAKFVECTLGLKYRTVNSDGSISGGPMYYISKGLAEKGMKKLGLVLAFIFSICCFGFSLGGGNMFQINQATAQLVYMTGGESSVFYGNGWIVGVIVAVIVALVIMGGIKSIAKVTEKIVPLMMVVYLVASLVVILYHFTEIPAAFTLIFKEAFTANAIKGGVIGCIIWGLRRSVSSNEAGIGSASIAYSAVSTKEPVSQGFVSLLEPFIDTIVFCSLTAFVIIITGMYTNFDSISGVELTMQAFGSVIPYAEYVLGVAIVLFALSTLISWSYYGLKSWTYVFGESKFATKIFQLIFCLFIVVGSSMNFYSVVEFMDAMMFAMAVPNIIAVYILLPDLLKDLKLYCEKYGVGNIKLPVLSDEEIAQAAD